MSLMIYSYAIVIRMNLNEHLDVKTIRGKYDGNGGEKRLFITGPN